MIAITLAIELLLMNGIGIWIRRSGVVSRDFAGQLTGMLMKFCIPCLIFYSISNAAEFSVKALANCAVVMVLAAAAMAASLGIGQLFYLMGHRTGISRIVRYGLTFSHFSFMGIPVIAALLGEAGTFYYSFFLIPIRITYYALSERLMTAPGQGGGGKKPGKAAVQLLLNPCMVAMLLGLIFWVGGWKLPTALNYCVKSLQVICSPLALLLCGMVIAEYDFKRLLRPEYLYLPLLRTILMPAVFFGISRLLLLLGVDALLCKILVVYAALPVAALLPVYAIKYDPDPDNQLNAAGASVISVLVSAVTIPLWYLLL